MLDHFSISHNSGIILWSRSFTPNFATLVSTASSPLNALIRESFIEGKATDNFERDGYNIRWTMENSLGLVFVVVFPALLPLTYIPALLSRVKQLFVSLFQTYISSFISALSDGSSYDSLRALKEKMLEDRWDGIFDRCLRDCENAGAKRERETRASGASSPVSEDNASADEIAKNVAALKNRMKRGRKGSPLAAPVASPAKNASKLMRKWENSPVTKEDMAALDYSNEEAPVEVDVSALVSNDAMGVRNKAGLYEVAEWDARLPSEEEILARRTADLKIEDNGWTSVFSRLRSKNLTKEDLEPALAAMEKNLLDKNVAKDIAEKLCESVGTALVGKKLGTFTSVKSEVESAFSGAITRILTPKTSTDLLVEIKRKDGPYSITFVGVNGVGKSTNLSKVCFWLLQNGLRVLIAACDTFRSGAVEQLRVHVRNLGALGLQDKVELYERGYGKDAAGIAKDAIAYAASNQFDVVLIDTAGRMQDNEPLMRALAKLVTVNNPDKLVFVGEALVGNEAVDQLTKFDRALKDFSSLNGQRRRGIDGIILTKFDTIDDKVGAALSMTYATGQPILFVGCGQTYTDLRHLRVNHIVSALLA